MNSRSTKKKPTKASSSGDVEQDKPAAGIAETIDAAASRNSTLLAMVARQIFVTLLDHEITLELKIVLCWILLSVLAFSAVALIFVINALGAIAAGWEIDMDRYLVCTMLILVVVMLSTVWYVRASKPANALTAIRRLEPVTTSRQLRFYDRFDGGVT